MAVNTQKFLPGSTGTQKALPQAKTSSITLTSSDKKGSDIIHVKTIQIAKLLKGTLAADKKKLTDKKKEASQERKQDAETKLEKKPDPKKKLMMPKVLPKMGFLDWIKNYIGNILLGYFAVRLLKHLPALKNFFTGILAVGEFIIEWGGKILNGLATFIDWGYQAYDATRGFIKTIGGDSFLGAFDKFSGVVGTVIETLIMASIAIASQGDQVMDIAGDFIGDWVKQRVAQQVVQQGATTATSTATAGGTTASTAGTATGMGAAATAAVVAGAGLLASALGEGAFQLRKMAKDPIDRTQKKFDKANWLDPRKYFYGATLIGQKMLLGPIAALGFILDIIGAPFRYAIELLRMPFLDEEGKKKQAHNLAKFDARIREDFRKGLNMLTLGFAFKEKGQFGNIYGNKDAQTEMMSKMPEMAGGGKASKKPKKPKITRAFRPKKRKKGIKRAPHIPLVKIDPGKNISKTTTTENAWWDFLGWAGTGGKEVKTTEETRADYFKKYGDKFGKMGYFGPISVLAVKALVGQKPTDREYGDAALGLSSLSSHGPMNILGFANGGMVDGISTQEDWMKDQLKKSFTPNVDKAVRQMNSNVQEGGSQDSSTTSTTSTTSSTTGPSTAKMPSGGTVDFWVLAAISSAESPTPQGRADVAMTIMNRAAATGVYGGGPTIKGLVNAGKQYEPVRRGDPSLWAKITDSNSAVAALNSIPYVGGKGKQRLEEAAKVLQNTTLMDKARKFIGGRTDFSTPSAMSVHEQWELNGLSRQTHKDKEVERDGHVYGWFVGPGAVAYGTKVLKAGGTGVDYRQTTENQNINWTVGPGIADAGATMAGDMISKDGTSPAGSPLDVSNLGGKKRIYLHWSAGAYTDFSGLNRYNVMYGKAGDRKVSPGGLLGGSHTMYRNDGVGLSAAAMGGKGVGQSNFGPSPITNAQMWSMARDAATIAKAMGYSTVTDKQVQTHGEAGSGTADNDELNLNYGGVRVKEGGRWITTPEPDNYGPVAYGGGAGARWDLDVLKQGEAIGTGGPIMRKMINSELAKFHKGGEVSGTGERVAKLLGGEIVIDVDSAGPAKNMLLAINQASGREGVMKAISDYAPYEAMQGNIVPYPIAKMVPVPMPSNSGGVVPIPMGGSAGGRTTEVLAAIG